LEGAGWVKPREGESYSPREIPTPTPTGVNSWAGAGRNWV